MKQFEYKREKNCFDRNIEQTLNKYGSEGWECFDIKTSYDAELGKGYDLYFKRELISTTSNAEIEKILTEVKEDD